jgi:hypothetical protein
MKKTILIEIILLLGSFILFSFPSYAKDVFCQMPYNKNVRCQLLTQGDGHVVNCSKNGKPGLSYRCTRGGIGWNCENKESPGAIIQQFSDTDFQDDVKRCDKLCEFCVLDWKASLERQDTDAPKKEGEDKTTPEKQKRPPVTGLMSCATGCKNGPGEYRGSSWSRWNCRFDKASALTSYDQPNFEDWRYHTCTIALEGRLKSVASEKGSYKDPNECFEKFCIRKITEICGDEDRCSKAENWMRGK